MSMIHGIITSASYILVLTGSAISDSLARLSRVLRVIGFALPLIDALFNPAGSLDFQKYFVVLATLVSVAVTLHSEGYYRVIYGKVSYQQSLLNTVLVTVLTVFNARLLGEFVIGLLLLDLLLILVILMDKGAENYGIAIYYIVLSTIPADIAVLTMWATIAQNYGLEASLTTSFSMLALHKTSIHPLVATLILIGYTIKLGLFPLHIWLPIVHPEAPKHGSAILSGLIIKIGVFGLLLASMIFAYPGYMNYIILVQGAITALYGSFAATLQKDIRRLLAYSSLGHAGVIAILYSFSILYGDPLISYLLYFYIIYHGVVKAHAFMNAALMDQLANTYDIYKLGYLGQLYPSLIIPAFNIFMNFAGIPPSYGFMMKLMLLITIILLIPSLGIIPLLTSIIIIVVAVFSILYSIKIIGCYIGGYRKVVKPPVKVMEEELFSEYYIAFITLILPIIYIALSMEYMPGYLAITLLLLEAISLLMYTWILFRKPMYKTGEPKYWLSGVEQ
ncbi:NADH/Ubiquinone/plastoquinone (complex I) [Desulfurococcus amylolyticus DSM 16532]|uniref:NADH/Ubiquinone/plastoquinone (Complex I) n=2 Tax=Desulfurococcus amylolyticus TaxID=94694 RepID=I3XST4_DESAM|nr:NADH/Ubiquinone/plastoquinone (complex I) [Desulfurococcus amylolyticus DSM 16532]